MAEGTCSQCGASVLKNQTNCPGCGAVLSSADFPIDPNDDFLKQPPSPPPASPEETLPPPPPLPNDIPTEPPPPPLPNDIPTEPPPPPPSDDAFEFDEPDHESEPPPPPPLSDAMAPPGLSEESYEPPPPMEAQSGEKSSKSKLIIIIPVALIVLLLLAFLGLKFVGPMLAGKDKPKPKPTKTVVTKPTPPPKTPVTAPVAQPETPKPVSPPAAVEKPKRGKISEDAVNETIDAWAAAWNNKDFKAYRAMYARNFRGVKRTIRPRTSRYSYNSWMRDRRGMLNGADWTKVEISNIEIISSTKKQVKVKFTQKYTSDTYNDVGPKIMTLVKSKKGLKIKYEEMLEANPI